MQETTAKYHANLIDQTWYCHVGERPPDAPSCSSMTEEQVLNARTCNCSDSWVQEILPHFSGPDDKRVLKFQPKSNLALKDPQQFLTLQYYFNYNVTKESRPILRYPNLWLLVYDPATDPFVAWKSGISPMTLMNAHGVTTLSVTINYIKPSNGDSFYKYDINVYTSPAMNLSCDVSGDLADYHDCPGTILVRFPQFNRTVVRTRRNMVWSDVVASAGSYFALSQLVSWLVSGLFAAK